MIIPPEWESGLCQTLCTLSHLLVIPTLGGECLIPAFQMRKWELEELLFQRQIVPRPHSWDVSEPEVKLGPNSKSIESRHHKLSSDEVLYFPNTHFSTYRLGEESFTWRWIPDSNAFWDQAGGQVGWVGTVAAETPCGLLEGAAAIQLQLIVAEGGCRCFVTTPIQVPKWTENPDFYVKC